MTEDSGPGRSLRVGVQRVPASRVRPLLAAALVLAVVAAMVARPWAAPEAVTSPSATGHAPSQLTTPGLAGVPGAASPVSPGPASTSSPGATPTVSRTPNSTRSPVAHGDWLELAFSSDPTTAWSPDGRWLLVGARTGISLFDVRDGQPLAFFGHRHVGSRRGLMWLDDRRFLIFSGRRSRPDGDDGLASARLGEVGSSTLVEVRLPERRIGGQSFDVQGLSSGHGVAAFSTWQYRGVRWQFRMWTPDEMGRDVPGYPIAWSTDGTRLALLVNEGTRSCGALVRPNFDLACGNLSVVGWPGLETVFADESLVALSGAAWDATGRYLAFTGDGAQVLDLETGEVTRLADGWTNEPAWDVEQRLFIADGRGNVTAHDVRGRPLVRWADAGQRVFGAADGTAVVIQTDDAERGAPNGLYTIVRGPTTGRLAVPFELRDGFQVPSLAPGAGSLIVRVDDESASRTRILFLHLDDHPPAPGATPLPLD